MKRLRLSTPLLFAAGLLPAVGAEPVDFIRQAKPILEATCLSCHGPEKPKGELRLDTRAGALKGGEKGTSLVPGKPAESPLYTSTVLPPDHLDIMPPKGEVLDKYQTGILQAWIEQGAPWPESEVLKTARRIDFKKDVQPILEFQCVACHREGEDKGKLRLDTKEGALKGGDDGPSLIPSFPEKSSLYTTTVLPADHDDLMPPAKKGGPLPKETTDILKEWIDQGAPWPEGLTLVPRKPEEAPAANEAQTVAEIHKLILSKLEAKTPAWCGRRRRRSRSWAHAG